MPVSKCDEQEIRAFAYTNSLRPPHEVRFLLHALDEARASRDSWERAMRQTCEYACKGEDGSPRDLESLRRVQSPEPGDMCLAVYAVLRDLWGEKAKRALGEDAP